AASERISFDNAKIFGTINLTGGRIDDLHLHDYYTTIEKKDHVVVLSPAGGPYPRYLEQGWVAQDDGIRLPDKDTRWRPEGNSKLTPGHPVTLVWDNGQGLRFEKT